MSKNSVSVAEVFVPGQVWTGEGLGKVLVVSTKHSLEQLYITKVSADSLGDATYVEPSGEVMGVDATLLCIGEGDVDAYLYTVGSAVLDAYRQQMADIFKVVSSVAVSDAKPAETDSEPSPKPKLQRVQITKPKDTVPDVEPYVYEDGSTVSFDELRERAIRYKGVISADEAMYLATSYLGHKPMIPDKSASGKTRRWDFASGADMMRLYNHFGAKVVALVYGTDNITASHDYSNIKRTKVGHQVAEKYPEVLA